ncbi:major facilitator superfamily domain-containing protein [Rhypophila decipiens]|uniref:Major facilitator superfamily domain-containing protein n=1 Tax=Rhypophila decipiens TaxID=261697 RepID=A0AAN6Y6Q6_9PEZI|nr:major facilitator superfamily domain-containing protein [Rhypophila decipiens]
MDQSLESDAHRDPELPSNSSEAVSPNSDTYMDTEKTQSGSVKPPPEIQRATPKSPNETVQRIESGYSAWYIILGGWCGQFCTFGLANCIGVFVTYYAEGPLSSYSPSTISWITSVQVWSMVFFGLFFGRIFDLYGPRYLLILGSLAYITGLMMISVSKEYYQFFQAQAVLASVGSAAVFNACISSAAAWFSPMRTKRKNMTATALGIMSSEGTKGAATSKKKFTWGAVIGGFKELPFVLTVVASFLFFWGVFLPLSYILLQAKDLGLDENVVEYLLPIINAVSIIGRIFPAIAADRVGRFNVMILVCALSSIVTLGIWIPGKSVAAIILYAVLFGLSSGGFISLLPAVIAQVSPEISQMGVRTGAAFAVASFGSLTGSPIAGAVVSAQGGSYLGLQIFCGCTILASVLVFVAARGVQVGFLVLKKV